MREPKKRIKKTFRNNAEYEKYARLPREIERAQGASGDWYCIFDYGNALTYHFFEVQVYNQKYQAWLRVSDVTLDWVKIAKEFARILALPQTPTMKNEPVKYF